MEDGGGGVTRHLQFRRDRVWRKTTETGGGPCLSSTSRLTQRPWVGVRHFLRGPNSPTHPFLEKCPGGGPHEGQNESMVGSVDVPKEQGARKMGVAEKKRQRWTPTCCQDRRLCSTWGSLLLSNRGKPQLQFFHSAHTTFFLGRQRGKMDDVKNWDPLCLVLGGQRC